MRCHVRSHRRVSEVKFCIWRMWSCYVLQRLNGLGNAGTQCHLLLFWNRWLRFSLLRFPSSPWQEALLPASVSTEGDFVFITGRGLASVSAGRDCRTHTVSSCIISSVNGSNNELFVSPTSLSVTLFPFADSWMYKFASVAERTMPLAVCISK